MLKNKIKSATGRQWRNFGIWTAIYLLFCLWMENAWMLPGVILIVDIFLTKYIPWGGWKKSRNPLVRRTMEWVDDILFALIAVYIINLFVFQNYQIPSPSLEKSLLVGDYLFVSKLSYGPRVPNTPISFPLVQNTLPVINTNSYIEWPSWGYKRVAGFGHVKRNDIVVFNFPAGDTIAFLQQNPDYYSLVEQYGREAMRMNEATFGKIMYRPVDKRENYVKRCIGMPGDSLSVKNNQVYIDGAPAENPKNIQYNYFVETDGSVITPEQFKQMGVSRDDITFAPQNVLAYAGIKPEATARYYHLPLTNKALEYLKNLSTIKSITIEPETFGGETYPVGYETIWTRDNFGPLWIPKKGATIELNQHNIALYKRCICNYENNDLRIARNMTEELTLNGGSPTVVEYEYFINGEKATTYTFKYDYYFMMGDNRHNSSDSRVWGFVPEDHIVGKPILIWLSIDKDHSLFKGGIRWNRIFRTVHSD